MAIKCQGCRKQITGTYQKALGANWHPQCLLCKVCRRPMGTGPMLGDKSGVMHPNCFLCTGCGRPIGSDSFHQEKGRPWHPECFRDKFGKRCAVCGEFLEGKFIHALGHDLHASCFRCTACGKSIGGNSFLTKEQQPYHEACYHQAFTTRCDICDQPLLKGGLKDAWGNTFCKVHKKKLPECFSCGRLICDALTGGGVRLKDKRYHCNLCKASAVNDPALGQRLLEEVRAEMEQMGFAFGDLKIPFRLVGQDELKRLSKKKKKGPLLGMARSTRMMDAQGKVVDRKFEEVIILYGLPLGFFKEVASHELTHTFLFLQRFDNLNEKAEEGLCTLTEYLYLSRRDSDESRVRMRSLMENKDPVYGDGFRLAYKAWQKLKLKGLYGHVRRKGKLPGQGLGRFLGLG